MVEKGSLKILSSFVLSVLLLCLSACGGANSRMSPANAGTQTTSSAERVNINTASEGEISKLPFIGPKLAADIVEHRTHYGPFRRPEHLMLIQGISEKRYRSIQNLIKTE